MLLVLAGVLLAGCDDDEWKETDMPMNADLAMAFPKGAVFQVKPGETLVIPFSIHGKDENLKKATVSVENKGAASGNMQDWRTSIQYSAGDTTGTVTLVTPATVKETDATFTLTVNNGSEKMWQYDFRVDMPLIVLSMEEAGEIAVPVYKNTQIDGSYTFRVLKEGADMPTRVQLKKLDASGLNAYNLAHGTQYSLLPADCISYEKDTLGFVTTEQKRELELGIKYDAFAKLTADHPGEQYAIPVELIHPEDSLSPEKKLAILLPGLETPQVVCQEEETAFSWEGNKLKVAVSLKTDIGNQWGGSFSLTYNKSLLDDYNQAHGTNYKLFPMAGNYNQNTIALPAGVDEGVIHLSFDWTPGGSGIVNGEPYVLPLQLNKVAGDVFDVTDEGRAWLLVLNHEMVDRALSLDMLKNSVGPILVPNSWGYTDGAGLGALVDNDVKTYCHTDYKNKGGWDDTYGQFCQVDFEEPTRYFSFNYTGRDGNSDGNPALFEVYAQGATGSWTLLKTVDLQGTPAATTKTTVYDSEIFSGDAAVNSFRFVVRKRNKDNANVTKAAGSFALSGFKVKTGNFESYLLK